MVPRVPAELLARLVGLLIIGVCIPWAASAILELVTLTSWPAYPDRAASGVLVWIALVVEQITWEGAFDALTGDSLAVPGLGVGLYFLYGGVWPLRAAMRREFRRG